MIPEALHPENWPERTCRQFVSDMYHRLLDGSEVWLDENATCSQGALPSATDNIRRRFTSDFQSVTEILCDTASNNKRQVR